MYSGDLNNGLVQYSGDLNLTILNPETFEIRTFARLDFKWLDLSYDSSYSSNHSISRLFCPDFKWFLIKWQIFVQISNGWTSGFQITFDI